MFISSKKIENATSATNKRRPKTSQLELSLAQAFRSAIKSKRSMCRIDDIKYNLQYKNY